MSSQSPIDENAPLLHHAPIAAPLLRHATHLSTVSYSNGSPGNLYFRIGAAMYSFAVLGVFTSSIGVMLHPMSKHYSLSDIHVSLIFLVGPVGYIIAAQSNDFIHSKFGQRGIAFLGPLFHILAAVAIATHPPFPLILIAFAFVALGTGILDGSWCAWAGAMENANTVSGLLHGSFSAGAAAGPILAGAMMDAGHRSWYDWYFVLLGASVLEFIVLPFAFRNETASKYRLEKQAEVVQQNPNLKEMLKYPATWFSSLYFLAYVGNETAISGWIVSFMLRARHSSIYLAALASSGFWGGMAVGRFVLGNVTDRIGVRKATIIYFLFAIVLQTIFTFVRVPVVSVIVTTLLGFSMGPLFPSGVVVLTRLLPKELHIAAVSFTASIGQVGGALLPFGIGAVIEGLGIRIFQYAIIAQLIISLGLWIAYTRLRPTFAIVRSRED